MKNSELNLLSKYRTQLMGLAMLLILIFHSSIDLSHINIIRSLKDTGDVGVDIFLLLSGIGLYFSYTKNNNKKYFYRKRVLRILPTFIPVAVVWYCAFTLVFRGKIIDIFLGITTLGFWIKGSLTWWFISAIFVLYIVTPFYLDFMNKNPRQITLITSMLLILLGLIIRFTVLDSILDYLLIFICRIPIFIIGLYIGNRIINKEEIFLKNSIIYFFAILGLIISLLTVNSNFIYIPFALRYYAYIPLSLSICLLATSIMDKFSDKKFKLLTFLGMYSLEIYLFHERILFILSFSEKIIVIDRYHIVLNIIAYLLAVIVAYLWSNIVSKFISRKKVVKN